MKFGLVFNTGTLERESLFNEFRTFANAMRVEFRVGRGYSETVDIHFPHLDSGDAAIISLKYSREYHRWCELNAAAERLIDRLIDKIS